MVPKFSTLLLVTIVTSTIVILVTIVTSTIVILVTIVTSTIVILVTHSLTMISTLKCAQNVWALTTNLVTYCEQHVTYNVTKYLSIPSQYAGINTNLCSNDSDSSGVEESLS